MRERVEAALARGEVTEARRFIVLAHAAAEGAVRDELAGLLSERGWPDPWLVAAVACEPPDMVALDALVARYWRLLHGRCEMLTMDRERASDLAQEAWGRVLRARGRLLPRENFAGYITTVATNIWRDWNRTARRAGALAEHRLAPLDTAMATQDGDGAPLADVLPDPAAIAPDEAAALRMDLERALARLGPRSRDLLTARYLNDESAADIGVRYGRTEQTITTWLRRALRELREFLQDLPQSARRPRSP